MLDHVHAGRARHRGLTGLHILTHPECAAVMAVFLPQGRWRLSVGEWQPIETLPEYERALVCVTYNVSGETAMEWHTDQWVDMWFTAEECDCEPPCREWFSFPRLIEIPCSPTHWMPLPPPPGDAA